MLKTASGLALAIVALAAAGCAYEPAPGPYASYSYQPYAYSGVTAGISTPAPQCGAAHDCRGSVGAPYAIQGNSQ